MRPTCELLTFGFFTKENKEKTNGFLDFKFIKHKAKKVGELLDFNFTKSKVKKACGLITLPFFTFKFKNSNRRNTGALARVGIGRGKAWI